MTNRDLQIYAALIFAPIGYLLTAWIAADEFNPVVLSVAVLLLIYKAFADIRRFDQVTE
jgi:hypothetical protein